MIDFGPYPLHKDWLVKGGKGNRSNKTTGYNESRKVFLPPDCETDSSLGYRSLVVEYKKDKLTLDEDTHLKSRFC